MSARIAALSRRVEMIERAITPIILKSSQARAGMILNVDIRGSAWVTRKRCGKRAVAWCQLTPEDTASRETLRDALVASLLDPADCICDGRGHDALGDPCDGKNGDGCWTVQSNRVAAVLLAAAGAAKVPA